MDYELKCVIAFCLIVKMAALSSGYTVRERFDQNFTRAQFVRSPSLLTIQTPRTTSENQVMDFSRRLGKGKMAEGNLSKNIHSPKVRKVKGRFRIDPCANMLELMEHPVRWKKIQKTLHWLDRLLASNKSDLSLSQCLKRKNLEEKSYKMKRKKSYFQETGENPELKERLTKDFHREREKNSNYLIVNRARDLINSHNSNIYSERRNKKLKKGGKGKHKTRKNRSKHKGNKSGKLRLKGKGKFSHNGTHSRNKDLTTYLKPINDILKISNDKILKADSVLGKAFGVAKSFDDRKCQSFDWNFQNLFAKPNDCGPGLTPRRWESSPTQDSSTEVVTPKPDTPKMNNWPHFVYHRVSSNPLDPDSKNQSHRRSAYVAISVASSDSSGTKKPVRMFMAEKMNETSGEDFEKDIIVSQLDRDEFSSISESL